MEQLVATLPGVKRGYDIRLVTRKPLGSLYAGDITRSAL